MSEGNKSYRHPHPDHYLRPRHHHMDLLFLLCPTGVSRQLCRLDPRASRLVPALLLENLMLPVFQLPDASPVII